MFVFLCSKLQSSGVVFLWFLLEFVVWFVLQFKNSCALLGMFIVLKFVLFYCA